MQIYEKAKANTSMHCIQCVMLLAFYEDNTNGSSECIFIMCLLIYLYFKSLYVQGTHPLVYSYDYVHEAFWSHM